MNMKRIKGLVTRMLLVVSLLLGVVAFTAPAAQAQRWGRGFDRQRGRIPSRVFVYPRRGYWPNRWYWYGYPYGYPSYYLPTHVSEGAGYHDGLDDGKDDAKHRKANDPYRHKDYKNAETSGYISGYLRGYAEGYGQAVD